MHLIDEQDALISSGNVEREDDSSTIASNPGRGLQDTTPNSGLRRRKNATPLTTNQTVNMFSSPKPISSAAGRYSSRRSPHHSAIGEKVFSQRKSLFERALHKLSPTGLSQRSVSDEEYTDKEGGCSPVPLSDSKKSTKRDTLSPYLQRRRWGNAYDKRKGSTPNLTSPPITSLKSGYSGNKMRKSTFQWGARCSRANGFLNSERGKRGREDDDFDASCDREMFFSSPGVPRGIGKRKVCSVMS